MTRLMLLLGGSPLVSIVVKATVIAALGLIGSWLARGSRAAVRHAVLAASFVALLALPVASFLVPAVHIAVAQEQIAPSRLPEAVETTQPSAATNTRAGIAPSISRWSVPPLDELLFAAWIAGVVFFLLRIIVGLRQVRVLRRFGLPWREGQIVVERIAAEAGVHRYVEVFLHESLLREPLAVPVTCGVVHPAIVLPPDARNWEGEDLGRAIVHELEHVRRWDWASQCLARAVCAAYWFHPLVWAAWRQFSLEAERACDDAVLRGSEATAYADQLVELAQRLSTGRKSPALAMANRSDLSSRVRAVLDSGRQRGRAGRILVTIAFAVAALVVVTMSPLKVVAAPQAASDPAFEVASVAAWPGDRVGGVTIQYSPDSLTLRGIDLQIALTVAYGLRDFQISGPEWLRMGRGSRYDILAKASGPVSSGQLRLMLRTLLTERFQMAVHMEKKEVPVLALLVGKGGPKFRETAPGTLVDSSWLGFDNVSHEPDGHGGHVFINAPMAALAAALSASMPFAPEPVVDLTGLSGRYDFVLHDAARPGPGEPPNFDDMIAAQETIVRDELGLTLEVRQAPVDMLVVDHADKVPTEN